MNEQEITNPNINNTGVQPTSDIEVPDEKIVEKSYTDPITGKFAKGNPGKPKGAKQKKPLKEFSLNQFNQWTDKQKQEFIDKIPPLDRWRMTEGNPQTDTDITSGGEKINPIYGAVSKCSSNEEGIQPKEEN